MPNLDDLKDWDADFLKGKKEVVIRRTPVRRRAALNESGDIRLTLKLAADELEESISGSLGKGFGKLRNEIANKKFPAEVAMDQFKLQAGALAKRAAEECSTRIDKLLGKLDADRDPEFDSPFSQQERDQLHERYRKFCEAMSEGEAARLASSIYAGKPTAQTTAKPDADKGNFELLRGHESVADRTAARYLKLGTRQIQKLVKAGTLSREGGGRNKKIVVHSLLIYLPAHSSKEKTN